jgi:alkylhydroperoxidase family enzyme
MAWIPIVDETKASPAVRDSLAKIGEMFGGHLTPAVRAMANNLPVLKAFVDFRNSLFNGGLDPRHFELAYIRASTYNECRM